MTAVTFPLRPPRLAFAICGWRWQNDVHEIKYSVCVCVCVYRPGKATESAILFIYVAIVFVLGIKDVEIAC